MIRGLSKWANRSRPPLEHCAPVFRDRAILKSIGAGAMFTAAALVAVLMFDRTYLTLMALALEAALLLTSLVMLLIGMRSPHLVGPPADYRLEEDRR